MASCFYDTSSLLTVSTESLLSSHFYISSITLKELEEIKTNQNKSQELKYKAREIVRLIDSNRDAFTVVFCNDSIYKKCGEKYFMPTNNDNLILTCATETSCDVVYSEDLCMRIVGRDIFGLNMSKYDLTETEDYSSYTGYKQVQMSPSEYAIFLHSLNDNPFGCVINEYLVVYSWEFDLYDCFKWSGNSFVPTYSKQPKSVSMDDKLKPKDEFQRCAIDALLDPDIKLVALGGKAGSGKTFLNLMCSLSLVDTCKYDRIVFTSNNIPMRGCASYGYTPGTLTQKLTDANEGSILLSKFDDVSKFNSLIVQDKLRLLDLSSCRGTEIKKSILMCSEMQNTSTDIMKTIITRIHASSKMVFDFDAETQIDNKMFEQDNGALRTVGALRGQKEFAYIYLPNIYRSELAKLAELI